LNSITFYFTFIVSRKTKKRKKSKIKPTAIEPAVSSLKPPFQLAEAARQLAANHTSPAAIVANLPPVQMAVGTNRHLWRR
jgi:hypothetical protein